MSSQFHSKIRRYTIFAILDEILDTVYVGKSYAKNPKTRYYAHMRGEYALTRAEYVDADITDPGYYVLEIIDCTGSTAYKHCLAWYNYFEELGYCVLTNERDGYMIDNMSYETHEIYQKVCEPYTLDEVLTRVVMEPNKNQNNHEKNAKNQENKERLLQLNIRVKESVIHAFRLFCAEREITQSEGLRLLLLSKEFSQRNILFEQLQCEFNEKKAEIKYLEGKIHELKDAHRAKESWTLRQRNAWMGITKAILATVVDQPAMPQYPPETIKKPLNIKRREGNQMFHQHQYPLQDGCYQVTICGIVRGLDAKQRTPDHKVPMFLCGKTTDGTLIKFRIYPSKDFPGILPNKDTIAQWGDSWLLGCMISKDGATNLVCALPMRTLKYSNPLEFVNEEESHFLGHGRTAASLNSLIDSAAQKAKR